MTKFEVIEDLVVEWAKQKGIAYPENAIRQLCKFNEEAGEVNGAFLKNNKDKLADEIGDVLVTLSIFAYQNELNLTDCLSKAYNKIKDRTGSTINGNFVKESDLC